jgi:hypothetical protein
LIPCNRTLHRIFAEAVTVEHRTPERVIRGAQSQGLDFDNWKKNGWLAVNQLRWSRTSVRGGQTSYFSSMVRRWT